MTPDSPRTDFRSSNASRTTCCSAALPSVSASTRTASAASFFDWTSAWSSRLIISLSYRTLGRAPLNGANSRHPRPRPACDPFGRGVHSPAFTDEATATGESATMLTPTQVIPFLSHEDPDVRSHARRYLVSAHDPS